VYFAYSVVKAFLPFLYRLMSIDPTSAAGFILSVSKQRPSIAETLPADKASASLDYWRKRVFKNSYTRSGKQRRVKHWSVKVQRDGVRRTLALQSRGRTDAAIEAQELYRKIDSQGQEERGGANRYPQKEEASGFNKNDPRYWELRLLRRRNYAAENSLEQAEYSVRIEHLGRAQYFPLQTSERTEAAINARDIYRRICREGWEAASKSFVRELTVAIHWSDNPLAWTYSTLRVTPSPRTAKNSPQLDSNRIGVPVIIFDSDQEVCLNLAACIDRISGFFCVATAGTLDEAAKLARIRPPGLLLANHTLLASTDAAAWIKKNERSAGSSILFFGVYEDSDDVFRATPGGADGYLLKRTSTDRLLDPILDAVHEKKLSPEKIRFSIQNYFQSVIHLISRDDAPRNMEKLTRREHEILNLVSKGCVDKEIAGSLGISGWTVHGHLKKIFEKLGVHTRTEAAIKYLQK
jgi:DNA-binding NarL/FixJ family response regulator